MHRVRRSMQCAGLVGAVLAGSLADLPAIAADGTVVAGRRSLVSPERALRREALAAQMFPGSTLDWDREEVVWPSGRRQRFSLAFYHESTRRPDGEMFVVAASGVGDTSAKAISDAQAFKSVTTFGSGCRLSLMRIEGVGQVIAFRQFAPDVPAAYVACTRADLENAHASAGSLPPAMLGRPEPEWPWVFVQLSSLHLLPDAWALVTWATVIDSDSGQWMSLLPVWIEGARKGGGAIAFAIRNDRGEARDGNWNFHGLGARGDLPTWTVRIPCPRAGCIAPPEPVIDAALAESTRR